MILPDHQIRTLVLAKTDPIAYVPTERTEQWPWIENAQIQPASLDVRLGPEIRDPWTGEAIPCINEYPLYPGECVLAHTVERFHIPSYLVARVEGKSTWARRFLTVHSAGFIDPGFHGDITLEFKNDGREPIVVPIGATIAQVSFHMMAGLAERPYGSGGLRSHYQGQIGATPAPTE